MRSTRMVAKEDLSCDGCQYLMSEEDPRIEVRVPFDFAVEFLREDRCLDFHFHALGDRHDCFRYWAHSPRIMHRSLRERGLSEQQIDDFMALMLYRDGNVGPGVARPKEKVT